MACTRRALVAAAAWAAGLCGCSRSGARDVFYAAEAQARPSATLTVLGNSGDLFDHSVLAQAADDYMALNPDVLVSFDDVEGDLYATALERRRSTGHLDDVFMLGFDQVRAFDADGRLRDLSGLSGTDGLDGYARDACLSADGRLLALPTRVAPYGLLASTEACARLGLSVPASVDRLHDAAVEAGAALVEGDVLSLGRAFVMGPSLAAAADGAPALLRAAGPDPDAVADVFLPGFEVLARLASCGAVTSTPAAAGDRRWLEGSAFAAGEAPFLVAGSWAVDHLETGLPDLAFTAHPLPGADGAPLLVADLDTPMAVNAQTDNDGWACGFVEYLARPAVLAFGCDDRCCYRPVDDGAEAAHDHLLPLSDLRDRGRVVAGNGCHLPAGFDAALAEACALVLSDADARGGRDRLAEVLAR